MIIEISIDTSIELNSKMNGSRKKRKREAENKNMIKKYQILFNNKVNDNS